MSRSLLRMIATLKTRPRHFRCGKRAPLETNAVRIAIVNNRDSLSRGDRVGDKTHGESCVVLWVSNFQHNILTYLARCCIPSMFNYYLIIEQDNLLVLLIIIATLIILLLLLCKIYQCFRNKIKFLY